MITISLWIEVKCITNASTRFATFGILDFFKFTVLSGKFGLSLYGSKRVMQALYCRRKGKV
ncbi:hypothetical protein ERW51_18365 [Aliivibrio finisterrensis]|nr:hypothetical protein ERW54_18875 [Aliivibrio finisterrensis]RYU66665.1 hypothetical protein ERW51_18365 [Aliivibrio finisterrensis]RYU69636.1 hypothetical protein ERW48_18910 [Aliivibrio finisterrensis]